MSGGLIQPVLCEFSHYIVGMNELIDVAVLTTADSEAGVALGIHDAFWLVGRLWNQAHGLEDTPVFAPRIVTATDEPLMTATGVTINPGASISDGAASGIVFVPSLLPCEGKCLPDVEPNLLDWVKQSKAAGARIVSSCTGSFLLAEAGLLDGCEATTHWAFVETFRRRFPKVTVHGERTLVAADEKASVVTAGGASSWTDLTLYLVGRFAGEEEARRLARMSLFDWHHQGQNPYARLTIRSQTADAVVRQAQEWIALSYDQRNVIQRIIRRSELAERTFNRRFRAATGMSPLEYLQAVRLEEAKQQLESDDATVEEIASAVGYDDTSSFRRLFKSRTGLTPAEHRKRFKAPPIYYGSPKRSSSG